MTLDLKAKADLVGTVGYEEATHKGNFSIGPLNSPDDLVSNELGLLEDLPFSEFKLFDQRFGITAEFPEQHFKEGRVSLTQEGKPLTLRVISANGDEFEIPALIWIPQSVPFDSPAFRYRIKAGHINVVCSQSEKNQELEIAFDMTTPQPLLHQFGLLAARNFATQGPVNMIFETEIGELGRGTLNLTDPIEPWVHHSWTHAKYILHILGRERCKQISISFKDFWEAMRNQHLVSLMHEGAIRFEGKFNSELEQFDAAVGYSYGQLGKWSFGAVHEMKRSGQSQDGEVVKLSLERPRLVKRKVFKQTKEVTRQQIEQEFKAYRRANDKITATFNGGDLSAWSDNYKPNGDVTIEVNELD